MSTRLAGAVSFATEAPALARRRIARAGETRRTISAREARCVVTTTPCGSALRLDATAWRAHDAAGVFAGARRAAFTATTRHAAAGRGRRLAARTTLRSDGPAAVTGLPASAALRRTSAPRLAAFGAACAGRRRAVAVSALPGPPALSAITRRRRAAVTRRTHARCATARRRLAGVTRFAAACGFTRDASRSAAAAARGDVAVARKLVIRDAIAGRVHAAERVVRRLTAAAAAADRLQLLRAVAEIGTRVPRDRTRTGAPVLRSGRTARLDDERCEQTEQSAAGDACRANHEESSRSCGPRGLAK